MKAFDWLLLICGLAPSVLGQADVDYGINFNEDYSFIKREFQAKLDQLASANSELTKKVQALERSTQSKTQSLERSLSDVKKQQVSQHNSLNEALDSNDKLERHLATLKATLQDKVGPIEASILALGQKQAQDYDVLLKLVPKMTEVHQHQLTNFSASLNKRLDFLQRDLTKLRLKESEDQQSAFEVLIRDLVQVHSDKIENLTSIQEMLGTQIAVLDGKLNDTYHHGPLIDHIALKLEKIENAITQAESMQMSLMITTHHLGFALRQGGLLNATSSFKYSKKSVIPQILELVVRPTQTCGSNFSEPAGSFATPNFPAKYNANETCTWILELPVGYKAVVIFHNFETEWRKCINDFLDITSLVTGTEGALICGKIQPYYYYVASDSTMFRFHSDAQTEMTGFYATYFTYQSFNNFL